MTTVITIVLYIPRYWNKHDVQILYKDIRYLFPPCVVKLAVHFSHCTVWTGSSMQTMFTDVFTSVFIHIYTHSHTHSHSHSHTHTKQDLQWQTVNSIHPTVCNIVEFALFFQNCNNTYRIWCYSSVWVLASSSPASNKSEELTHVSEYCKTYKMKPR